MDFEPREVYRCLQVVPQEGTMDAIVMHVRRCVDEEKTAHRNHIAVLEGLERVLRPVTDSHQLSYEIVLKSPDGEVRRRARSLSRGCSLAVCAFKRMHRMKQKDSVRGVADCSVWAYMPSPYSDTSYVLPESFWQRYIP